MNFPVAMAGFKRLVADGIVGDSAKPIIITGYSMDAGGSAATTAFKDGTSASASVAFNTDTVSANTTGSRSFSFGVMLPNGCFVDLDANTSAITVFYIQAA